MRRLSLRWQKRLATARRVGVWALYLALVLGAVLALGGAVFMVAWNAAAPVMFGAREIGFAAGVGAWTLLLHCGVVLGIKLKGKVGINL